MKKLFKKLVLLTVLAPFIWAGCKRDDHHDDKNHEEITQITLTFTPASGGVAPVFQFTDPDGVGPLEPVKTEPTLRSNTSYIVTISTASKGKDLTNDIKKEGELHQFFFIRVPNNFINHTYQDNDKNGKPVGLVNNFQTKGATRGVLTVILRHQLNKLFSGLSELNYPAAGGTTDIEASFNVVVVD